MLGTRQLSVNLLGGDSGGGSVQLAFPLWE